jgi:Tol biopolymer transport system component
LILHLPSFLTYTKEKFNSIDSIKSLVDNESLANQPMPKMLKEFDWDTAKDAIIEKLIKSISKYLLNNHE